MNKKLHIALLLGGMSNEREVSISSGKAVSKALIELGYQVTEIDMSKNIYDDLIKTKPDLVYNSLHGKYGEDGCIQGLLEIIGIPYTHSKVLASSTAMNKQHVKNLAKLANIKTPEGKVLNKEDIIGKHPLERPYIIKPLCEGSSRGVLLIKENEDPASKDTIDKDCNQFLVEEYIKGIEICSAVIDEKPLGVIEMVYNNDFFDYESKYNGETEYVYPARIEKHAYDQIMDIAFKMHKIVGCSPISHSDYIYKDGNVYFIEINTHPGFTNTSLLPKIASYNDITFNELVDYIVKKACNLK